MADIRIKITVDGQDPAGFARDLASIPARVMNAAVPRAANRTATTVRAAFVKDVGAKINLKASSIREVVLLTRATRSKPVASVTISDSPRPVFDFKGVRAGKRGVSAEIYKGQGRTVFKHAFLARVGVVRKVGPTLGHVGVYQRVKRPKPGTKLTKKGYAGRLRIEELLGPSVTQTVTNVQGLLENRVKDAGDTFRKNLDHEIGFELSKAIGKK